MRITQSGLVDRNREFEQWCSENSRKFKVVKDSPFRSCDTIFSVGCKIGNGYARRYLWVLVVCEMKTMSEPLKFVLENCPINGKTRWLNRDCMSEADAILSDKLQKTLTLFINSNHTRPAIITNCSDIDTINTYTLNEFLELHTWRID